jgi:hypothetical protein
MSDSDVKEFLQNHPRLLGALFGMTVLLSQTGAAAAGNGHTISGI